VRTGRVVFEVAVEEVEAVEGAGARCDDAAALVESRLVAERCYNAPDNQELTSRDEGARDALDEEDIIMETLPLPSRWTVMLPTPVTMRLFLLLIPPRVTALRARPLLPLRSLLCQHVSLLVSVRAAFPFCTFTCPYLGHNDIGNRHHPIPRDLTYLPGLCKCARTETLRRFLLEYRRHKDARRA
jgi:hypothetical protein